MATTKDRLEELAGPEGQPYGHQATVPPDGWTVPGASPTAAGGGPVVRMARKPFGVSLLELISGRWAAIGVVAWVVLLGIGIAVEPPPDNPNAVDPWLVSALGTVLLVALVATFAGLWARRRLGLAASLSASGLLVFSTVMCPVSGHHTHLGAWWIIQLGCGLGLVTMSVLGLGRAARGSDDRTSVGAGLSRTPKDDPVLRNAARRR
jgi:hypothetical protein